MAWSGEPGGASKSGRAFGLGLLGAIVGAVAGAFAGIGLGLAYTELAGTSGFEGKSGFVVAFFMLAGIVAGLIGGAVAGARLGRR